MQTLGGKGNEISNTTWESIVRHAAECKIDDPDEDERFLVLQGNTLDKSADHNIYEFHSHSCRVLLNSIFYLGLLGMSVHGP